MRHSLRISVDLFHQLQEHFARFRPREAAALVLVGRSRLNVESVLLARRAILLEPEAYQVQEQYRLVVHPRVINAALALCEANSLGIVFCHSHPVDIPYSASDDEGEARLSGIFSQFLPDLPFGSLLLCPGITLGRVWTFGREHEPLSELRVIGSSLERIRADGTDTGFHTDRRPEFDRQARALGADGQAKVSVTKVAIVGLGGTGTPTAEQLVRMGVRDVVLVDPDVVDETTITRAYGTFHRHAYPASHLMNRLLRRRPTPIAKVDAAAEHLRLITPHCHVQARRADVVETETARMLLDRDVVFSCVDEHWGRAIMNEIAYQYLIPVINMGVRLDVRDGRLIGAAGAVQVLRPGAACLWCSGLLDPDRIRAESLSAGEYKKLEAERYIVGLERRAPSVVSLTTTISGLAVTAFLHLVTGFLGDTATFARQNYFIQEGIVSRGATGIRADCACGKVLGFGDLKPLSTVRERNARRR